MNKIRTITICGPTASGKTYLGVELAKKLNGEIVSADSIQIYKGVDIASVESSVSISAIISRRPLHIASASSFVMMP